jgi:SatD family (SatD)
MKEKRYVVLIADVVGSRTRRDLRALLGQRLAKASRAHLRGKHIRLPYAVTAGDEFQTIMTSYARLPELIFDLRELLRPLRLRMGIGIGTVSGKVHGPVNRLGGEAFQFARQALERVKGGEGNKFRVLTGFKTQDTAFDSTANLIYALQDTLLLKVTEKQWETIAVFRKKRRLRDTAEAMRLDVSTVSRNLKRGYFWQVEETLKGMKTLLQERWGPLYEHVQK